jgi:glycosyltransferase involved in cell wall biosynthesis
MSRAPFVIDREPLRRNAHDRAAPPLMLSAAPRDWLAGHRVSVVMPALNKAACLPHVLPRLPAWVHEIVLVDGESIDRTVEVAGQFRPDARIVRQQGRGKGAALRSGVRAATGDIIVMLDADGSTDPAEIPAFVGALLAGADLAKGSRFVQGGGSDDMGWLRNTGNSVFARIANSLFKTRFSDITYGYHAVWARHRSALALEIDGWDNEGITNIRAARRGLKVVEVASFERARIGATHRLRLLPATTAMLAAMFAERFRKPSGSSAAYAPR